MGLYMQERGKHNEHDKSMASGREWIKLENLYKFKKIGEDRRDLGIQNSLPFKIWGFPLPFAWFE